MVRKLISFHHAYQIVTSLFVLIITFHLIVMAGFVPIDMVWGGRLKSREELIAFETLSLFLNMAMLTVVQVKAEKWKWNIHPKFIQSGLWIMVMLFAINTAGNLAALNTLETIIFTPITLALSILCWRLVID